jgi:hypothetical protein
VRSLSRHLSYANVLSTLCLFILLGGGAYAASNLPRNSVGTKQLKAAAVTGPKIKDGTITGAKIDSRTLATVPSAVSADRATSATTAVSAATATSATRATNADHADAATHADVATHSDKATLAENAEQLGGLPTSGFVSGSQVGFIEQTFSGCSVSVICSKDVLTIAGVTFRAICENAAGPGGLVIKVSGASRGSYGLARGGTESREGIFEGTGNVIAVIANNAEVVGATGTIMALGSGRVVSLHFEATARVPTINTAACTLYATALAV